MDRGIHVLGLGNLGKYVAYALRQGHQTDVPSRLPLVTLFFHKPYLLRHWESENRSISYIPEIDTLPPESRKLGRATGFRVELVGDAAAGIQPSEIENHPGVVVGSDAPIRHLIVATKTMATASAIAPIKHRLNKDSHILFLQNGMGVADEVSEKLFPDPESRPTYWAGICSAGIYYKSPFTFVHAGTGALSVGVVGGACPASDLPPPANMDRNPMVTQLLDAPLLGARLLSPERTLRAQLLKLVVNSIINPLTAIFGCKNGHLIESAEARDMSLHLLQEAGLIVRALLPRSSGELVEQEFTDAALGDFVWDVARKTANNTSSMLQDVRNGKPTEIDYINGYLVSQGQRLGLPTSHHAKICTMIKQLESEHASQRSRET
ncbi:ketopantoate reductase PanE/ApbA C terminal-domain-containing protein [Thermothelomyces heterothallicus CBS 202.75]|uniref:ketopantoate reductase PanE/ApbA C terminal-domain-containing protein n=1 Tax=Thermothelomyces heterothallicus CBS 202.75 TaxID=1149848 RepID=UPI00374206EB